MVNKFCFSSRRNFSWNKTKDKFHPIQEEENPRVIELFLDWKEMPLRVSPYQLLDIVFIIYFHNYIPTTLWYGYPKLIVSKIMFSALVRKKFQENFVYF